MSSPTAGAFGDLPRFDGWLRRGAGSRSRLGWGAVASLRLTCGEGFDYACGWRSCAAEVSRSGAAPNPRFVPLPGTQSFSRRSIAGVASTMSNEACAGLVSPIEDQLQGIYERHAGVREGAVATYIPELAKADPDWFGICLVTVEGHVYEVGDSRQPFTIQSISKPFVYGLALEDNTRVEVLKRVGVEPTGDAFNAISLEPGTGRPRNPMINAGAIASAGMVEGRSPATRLKRVLEMFSAHAGRALSIDETVYRSESETGHRNRGHRPHAEEF
jgi:hypothetical protein